MYRTKKRLLAYSILAAMGGLLLVPAVQAGDVTGLLADPATGKPLAGVAISIAATGQSVQTDVAGRFVLKDLPAGHYMLTAAPGASRSLTAAVDVPRQGTVTAVFNHATSLTKITVAANRYDASQLQMDATNTVNVLSAVPAG